MKVIKAEKQIAGPNGKASIGFSLGRKSTPLKDFIPIEESSDGRSSSEVSGGNVNCVVSEYFRATRAKGSPTIQESNNINKPSTGPRKSPSAPKSLISPPPSDSLPSKKSMTSERIKVPPPKMSKPIRPS